MARIRATIDYEPYLKDNSYPSHVKTKAAAMRFDVQQVLDGSLMDVEIIDWAEDIVWEVVDDGDDLEVI